MVFSAGRPDDRPARSCEPIVSRDAPSGKRPNLVHWSLSGPVVASRPTGWRRSRGCS